MKEKVDIHVECIPMGELEYNPLDIPIENKKSKVTLMSYFKLVGISLERKIVSSRMYTNGRERKIRYRIYHL